MEVKASAEHNISEWVRNKLLPSGPKQAEFVLFAVNLQKMNYGLPCPSLTGQLQR